MGAVSSVLTAAIQRRLQALTIAMARLFFRLSDFILFSRNHNNLRTGLLAFVSRLLVVAGVVFAIEIVLILLGMGEVFIPLTASAKGLLTHLMF
jgi:hypothetical protein